jgi:4-carboxymuconolactone decarboxylase
MSVCKAVDSDVTDRVLNFPRRRKPQFIASTKRKAGGRLDAWVRTAHAAALINQRKTAEGGMMSFGKGAVLAAGLAMALAAPDVALAQNAATPSDIHADSGNRLPPIKRDSLDATGQKTYDQLASPSGGSLAGLRGPGGINLYAPKVSELTGALNRYLRSPATGFDGHVRELAILVTAREFNSQFEWAAHENVALKEGVPPATIDVVKHRKSLRSVPEADAVIIQLGREIYRTKKVTSATYARAVKQFGPEKLINLVSLMGNYAGTAALLAVFDMQLPPGQKPLLPMP